jgi:purine-nucleoside phosphorylase
VDCIIRIGTCGAYTTELKLFDLLNVDAAVSESYICPIRMGIEGAIIPHQGKAFDMINYTLPQ